MQQPQLPSHNERSSLKDLSQFRSNRSLSQTGHHRHNQSNISPTNSSAQKAHYVNQHTPSKRPFFSLKRSYKQPGRYFSPELLHLQQPILRDGICANRIESVRIRDLTKEIMASPSHKGTFTQNYKEQISTAKDNLQKREANHMRFGKHGIAGLHLQPLDQQLKNPEECQSILLEKPPNNIIYEEPSYTHKPKVFNRQGLLKQYTNNNNNKNAFSDSKIVSGPTSTCFNLDMNRWQAQQQRELNTSQFQLLPEPSQLSMNSFEQQQNSHRRNRATSNYLEQSHLSSGSSIMHIDTLQQLYNVEPLLHTQKQRSSSKKPQGYLSPLFKKQKSTPPFSSKKKHQQHNKQHDSVNSDSPQKQVYSKHVDDDDINDSMLYKSNQLAVPTPLIYKALEIIESQKKEEIKQDSNGQILFRIDEGFGDHILKYHHITTRKQENLIPKRVLPQPDLLPMLTSYSQLPPLDNEKQEEEQEQH